MYICVHVRELCLFCLQGISYVPKQPYFFWLQKVYSLMIVYGTRGVVYMGSQCSGIFKTSLLLWKEKKLSTGFAI